MNIIIWKEGDYNRAEIFDSSEKMAKWAEANREKNFRAFQAQEMQVLKEVQFKLLPGSR